MAENLTPLEQGRLLAELDYRNREDYDRDYYNKLQKIQEPRVADLDDRVRRAISRYITDVAKDVADAFSSDEEYPPGAYLLEGWILGYVAGRNIKGSIFKKPFHLKRN